MDRKLYIADTKKFIDFFNNRTKHPLQVGKGGHKVNIIPIVYKTITMSKARTDTPNTELTSQTQDIVDRAAAAQKQTKVM